MMPERFPYPTEGWSTGQMRKVSRRAPTDPGYPIRELEGERKRRETKVSEAEMQRPSLSPEEWQGYFNKAWAIYGKPATIDPTKTSPDGFIIEKGHHQLKELEKDFDSYEIPDAGSPDSPGWSKDWLFMKPKAAEPLTSELPGGRAV